MTPKKPGLTLHIVFSQQKAKSSFKGFNDNLLKNISVSPKRVKREIHDILGRIFAEMYDDPVSWQNFITILK